MSRTVFARDRTLPTLVVLDDGVTHRVTVMTVDPGEVYDFTTDAPYTAECGRLIFGCMTIDAPVDCLECIAGREVLVDAFLKRHGV